MTGELKKMRIVAYSDERFESKVGGGEFDSLVNPENYSLSYKLEYDENQAPGTSAQNLKFNRAKPEELEFEFLFDKTGVIPGSGDPSNEDGIIEDIELFKKVVLKYEGEQHRPNYLILSWGTLLFKGCLKEMSIQFKLFKPDGTPIRAVAKAKFAGSVEDDLRVAKENAQSPDLTHVRTVQAGDTLPLMSYRIYGDSRYYLEVARVNKLLHFRDLNVGQKIYFPPIANTAL